MKINKIIIIHWQAVSMILFIAYCLLPIASIAQQEKKFIYDGNKLFENKNYTEAEKNYKQSLNKNKDSYKGAFNLGDTYYKQGKYEEAAEQFQSLTHKATSKDTLSKAYHNLGNSLLKQKKYQESVDAYKNALKNNPDDEDTRYNLAYAQQFLKQQMQQQKQNKDDKNKDKKDNKDNKDKDKQNKDDKDKKDKDKKENKDQEEKNKEQQDKEKQEQQKNQISKEDAKRLLDALQNDEKNLQDKMKKGKVKKGVKVQIEKDW